jgi:dihydrofolate reductase
MRKLSVDVFMTLDGVVQAPGQAQEDTSGGFEHGGWHLEYFDDIAGNWMVEGYRSVDGFLLGRRTYEILASYWPTAPEDQRAFGDPLNSLPKYVASRTLTEPLEWNNSHLLEGDVAETVAAMKQEDGKDLRVVGSGNLLQALMEHNLVDEFRLMIDPLVLGGGKRLFRGANRTPLRLVESQTTTTGAILATYATAEGR